MTTLAADIQNGPGRPDRLEEVNILFFFLINKKKWLDFYFDVIIFFCFHSGHVVASAVYEDF